MAMATRELCAMLGINADELHSSGDSRPRSMSAALKSPGFLQQQQDNARMLLRRNSEIVTPRSRASDSFSFRRRSRSIDEVRSLLGLYCFHTDIPLIANCDDSFPYGYSLAMKITLIIYHCV